MRRPSRSNLRGERGLGVAGEHWTERQDEGERLDRFLVRALAGGEALSRNRIKALIEAGAASVDGARVTDAAFGLRPGQCVRLVVPPPVPAEPQGEAIALDIRYEDSDLLVLDKPAGLVVHPAAGHS